MSAYLCSNKHISAIARAAVPGSAHATFGFFYVNEYIDMRREELAQLLYDANVRSLQARYPDNWKGMVGGPFQWQNVDRPKPLDGLKLCNGYAYQACESDDWQQTKAYAALLAIKEKLVRELPGYDEAEWSL